MGGRRIIYVHRGVDRRTEKYDWWGGGGQHSQDTPKGRERGLGGKFTDFKGELVGYCRQEGVDYGLVHGRAERDESPHLSVRPLAAVRRVYGIPTAFPADRSARERIGGETLIGSLPCRSCTSEPPFD